MTFRSKVTIIKNYCAERKKEETFNISNLTVNSLMITIQKQDYN